MSHCHPVAELGASSECRCSNEALQMTDTLLARYHQSDREYTDSVRH